MSEHTPGSLRLRKRAHAHPEPAQMNLSLQLCPGVGTSACFLCSSAVGKTAPTPAEAHLNISVTSPFAKATSRGNPMHAGTRYSRAGCQREKKLIKPDHRWPLGRAGPCPHHISTVQRGESPSKLLREPSRTKILPQGPKVAQRLPGRGVPTSRLVLEVSTQKPPMSQAACKEHGWPCSPTAQHLPGHLLGPQEHLGTHCGL